MDAGMFVASVMGPFMAILGLWMLISGDNVVKVWTAKKNSPVALYGSGVCNLLLGLIIINLFNHWQWDVFLFITILGWALFIKGVVGLFAPQLCVQVQMASTGWMRTQGMIPFVWGLILIWIGYFM